jgi:hypothetical protein
MFPLDLRCKDPILGTEITLVDSRTLVNNLVASPQLIIQTPGDVQHINLLARQEWTIGRDRANLICIPDRYPSR